MKTKVMRLSVLTLVCVLTALGCRAEYLPFLEVGKWWVVAERESRYSEKVYCYWKLTVNDSEIIDGRECFNVTARRVFYDDRLSGDNKWGTVVSPFTTISKRYYEEDGTVYRVVQIHGKEEYRFSKLFSLDMGDDASYTTLDVDGVSRKASYVAKYETWIIEGIGPSSKIWDNIIPIEFGYKHYHVEMVECREDDRVTFSKEDFENLIPPSVDGVEVMESENPDAEKSLMNLNGMPVSEPRSGEIYISEGKKILKK